MKLIRVRNLSRSFNFRTLASQKPFAEPTTDEHKEVPIEPLNEVDDAITRYEKATQSLSKKEEGRKTLSNEEKLKIAAVDFVSDKEAEKLKQQILKNKIHGVAGLFISLMGLTAGITLFLI